MKNLTNSVFCIEIKVLLVNFNAKFRSIEVC